MAEFHFEDPGMTLDFDPVKMFSVSQMFILCFVSIKTMLAGGVSEKAKIQNIRTCFCHKEYCHVAAFGQQSNHIFFLQVKRQSGLFSSVLDFALRLI